MEKEYGVNYQNMKYDETKVAAITELVDKMVPFRSDKENNK